MRPSNKVLPTTKPNDNDNQRTKSTNNSNINGLFRDPIDWYYQTYGYAQTIIHYPCHPFIVNIENFYKKSPNGTAFQCFQENRHLLETGERNFGNFIAYLVFLLDKKNVFYSENIMPHIPELIHFYVEDLTTRTHCANEAKYITITIFRLAKLQRYKIIFNHFSIQIVHTIAEDINHLLSNLNKISIRLREQNIANVICGLGRLTSSLITLKNIEENIVALIKKLTSKEMNPIAHEIIMTLQGLGKLATAGICLKDCAQEIELLINKLAASFTALKPAERTLTLEAIKSIVKSGIAIQNIQKIINSLLSPHSPSNQTCTVQISTAHENHTKTQQDCVDKNVELKPPTLCKPLNPTAKVFIPKAHSEINDIYKTLVINIDQLASEGKSKYGASFEYWYDSQFIHKENGKETALTRALRLYENGKKTDAVLKLVKVLNVIQGKIKEYELQQSMSVQGSTTTSQELTLSEIDDEHDPLRFAEPSVDLSLDLSTFSNSHQRSNDYENKEKPQDNDETINSASQINLSRWQKFNNHIYNGLHNLWLFSTQCCREQADDDSAQDLSKNIMQKKQI